MQIEKYPASIAFVVHCGLIFIFAIAGGIFHEVPTLASAFIYSVALVATYAALIQLKFRQDTFWGARLVFIHICSSLAIIVIGTVAEKSIPLVGGAASYVSMMSLYILNMPGLLLSKLLPYPGEPEILWQVLRYTVLISATAAWLFLAYALGSMLSRGRASHA